MSLIKLPCPPQYTIALVDTHPSNSKSAALTFTSTYAKGEYSGASEANRLGELNVELRVVDGDGESKDSPEEGPKVTLGCCLFPILYRVERVRRSLLPVDWDEVRNDFGDWDGICGMVGPRGRWM